MSSDNRKNPKQQGGKQMGKNNKKKQENSNPEKSETPTAARKPPHYPCFICNEDHFMRYFPHRSEVAKLLKNSNTLAMLTDPFLSPERHMVATDNASTSQVLMLSIVNKKNNVLVSTRNKYYGNPSSLNNQATDQPSSSTMTSPEVVPPIIPKLTIKPPKKVVHNSTFNPHARAAQNYNIVEDLAQSPSSMSTLEVLQHCPSQKQALLSAIGGIDPTDSNIVVFNHTGYTP